MPTRAATLLPAALATLLAGCASPAPEPVDEAAEQEAMAAAPESLGEAPFVGDMDATGSGLTSFETRTALTPPAGTDPRGGGTLAS